MNKKQSRGSKYVLFERKLMRKILSLVLVAICAVILLRELIRGRFGNTVVGFLTGLFRLDYDDALYIYELIFRDNLNRDHCRSNHHRNHSGIPVFHPLDDRIF